MKIFYHEKCFLIIQVLFIFFFPQALFAKFPSSSTAKIFVHPFKELSENIIKNSKVRNLRLFGDNDLHQMVKDLVKDQLVYKASSLQLVGERSGLALDTESNISYNFYYNNIKVCTHNLQATKSRLGEVFVTGTIPKYLRDPDPKTPWPELEDTIALIRKSLPVKIQVIRGSKCWLEKDDELVPVWNVILNTGSLSYSYQADTEEIYSKENLFFSVDATIQAYELNKLSDLKNFTLNLTDPNYLTNDFFTTNTQKEISGVSRASSDNLQFIFPGDDVRTAETSSFVHVNLQLQFFNKYGYTWTNEAKPLTLNLHDSTKNNAMYRPAEANTNGKPSIIIGDGDGIVLQSLAFDSDVVSHELGHHIVYRHLKNTSGESLVIHEGLADFFTFAKSGDPCLGESICPEQSSLCVVKSQCLRSALASVSFGDANWATLPPHKQGQVISGLLWGLRDTDKIGAEEVTAITYRAIDYLAANSGYEDLFVALILADGDLYSKQHACTIYEAAKAKGFSSYLNFSCTGDIKVQDSTSSSTSSGGSNKKSGNNLCGALGVSGDLPPGTSSGLCFLLLIALILPLFKKGYQLKARRAG